MIYRRAVTSAYKALGLYSFFRGFRMAHKLKGLIIGLKIVFQNKLHRSADQNTF